MKPIIGPAAILLTLQVLLFIVSCKEEPAILPAKVSLKATGSGALSFSGVLVIGAPQIPWTGQSGMLVYTVVRNHSEDDWRGHPEAAVYAINPDGTRGELIGTGIGVLTTFVNRELFVPTDELKYVPGNGEREGLTFVPVDFSVYPLVYVYWRLADEKDESLNFSRVIGSPKGQPQVTLAEAKRLLAALKQ